MRVDCCVGGSNAPRRGADARLEVAGDHAGAGADRALGHRAAGRRLDRACRRAPSGCGARRASFKNESSHSPTTGMITSSSTPMPGCFFVIHLTAASETLPTDMVLVSRIGVSSSPHSCDLRQARQLARAVEHEGAGDDALAEDVARRHDAGDAGAHRPLAAARACPRPGRAWCGRPHAGHVGDGVERPGGIAAERRCRDRGERLRAAQRWPASLGSRRAAPVTDRSTARCALAGASPLALARASRAAA